jgi:hypothetical protein
VNEAGARRGRLIDDAGTREQASVLLVGALAAVLVGVLVLGAVARGVAREAAAQRAVDLAALAGYFDGMSEAQTPTPAAVAPLRLALGRGPDASLIGLGNVSAWR